MDISRFSIVLRPARHKSAWVVWIVLGIVLSACSERLVDLTPPTTTIFLPTSTLTPTTPPPPKLATVTPTLQLPSATLAPTVPWWLVPPSRKMEDHGIVYDPNAVPSIPPEFSISMPIWGTSLPVKPIDGMPLTLPSTPPAPISDPFIVLEQTGCEVVPNDNIICPPDNPLSAFGCEYIYPPSGEYPTLGPDRALVAQCLITPPDEQLPTENDLFQRGCAFPLNTSHIFKVGSDYILVSSPKALKDFFGPIDTPEKALSYAQLRTGLEAQFVPEIDPDLLYFTQTLVGTTVTRTDLGYTMNLFHNPYCFCEPYINSQVQLLVDESGEVTWLSAIPLSMTLSFSCTD